MPDLSPKSLILDVLSAADPSEAVPVRGLVRIAALFGFEPGALRVALARLRAGRKVEAVGRGAYRLGRGARAVQEQVAAWRALEDRVLPSWAGGWIGAHTAALPRADRKANRARERALQLLGLRALSPGLSIRPDNLREGVSGVRARLQGLGLEAGAPVFVLTHLAAEDDARARALWDADALLSSLRAARGDLEASEQKLDAQSLEDACVTSFLSGGRAIRALVRDPLLPAEIVDPGERTALLSAMRRFDRRGRALWHQLLEREGVEPVRAPADLAAAVIA